MASYGVCIGVLASSSTPFIQVTPNEVKLAGTNKKTATKAQMIEWATKTYPYVNWFTNQKKGITTFSAKNEHLADAIACVHAGVKTDLFRTTRQTLIGTNK